MPRMESAPQGVNTTPIRFVLDALPQCAGYLTAVRDAAGRITGFCVEHINPPGCRNIGRPLAEQIGRRLNDLMPGHRDPELFPACCGVVDTGRPISLEHVRFTNTFDEHLQTRTYTLQVGRLGDGLVITWVESSAASALAASEERLRLASQAAGFGTYDYDVARGESIWSGELRNIVGFAAAGPVPASLAASLVHPADRAAFNQRVAERLDPAGSGHNAIEFRVLRPDGTVRWVRDVGRTYFEGTGPESRPSRVVGTIQDITDRRQAEEDAHAARARADRMVDTLRASEARFRSLADGLPQAVWEGDEAGRCAYANAALAAYAGFQGDHAGFDWFELVHPDDRSEVRARWLAAVESGGATRLEVDARFRRHDGLFRWFRITGGPVPDVGHAPRWVLAGSDIHEISELISAVRESEDRLWTAKEAAQLGIHEFNPLTGRILWDERVRAIWGVGPAEVITYELFMNAIHPDDRARTQGAVDRALDPQRGGIYAADYRVTSRRDGQTRWVFATGRVTFDGERPVRLVGTVQDITDRVAAADELARHREKLELLVEERTAELEDTLRRLSLAERMAALGTLSAGLGHDMGNILLPLRVSLGELQRSDLPATAAAHLDVVARSADYLKTIASGLRLLALNPEQESAVSPATRLDAWWTETEGVFRAAIPRHIALAASGLDQPPAIAIPAHALTQIAYNLVQNAGDALKERAAGTIRVEARRATDWVELCFRDNGPGMSAEVLARCLEPFFTTKARGRGTGLGLAIVYRLAARYRATLSVESAPGQGACFTLSIPVHVETAAAPTPARLTIADARTRAIFRSVLSATGAQVADDGSPPFDGPGIWVVDQSVPTADVADFISAHARRAVVSIGPDRVLGTRVVAIAQPKPALIRSALDNALRVARA